MLKIIIFGLGVGGMTHVLVIFVLAIPLLIQVYIKMVSVCLGLDLHESSFLVKLENGWWLMLSFYYLEVK